MRHLTRHSIPIKSASIFAACRLFLAGTAFAAAPVTESHYAGSISESDYLTGTVGWSSILSATGAPDGNLATVGISASAASRLLKLTNYGFTVPPDATILSVKAVSTVQRGGASPAQDFVARLTTPLGASTSWPAIDSWPSSPGAHAYPGATPLWNLALTPAIVNDIGFGFELAASMSGYVGTSIPQVDAVELQVRYVHWTGNEIGGIVFRDFDGNGVRGHGESPLSGAIVTAYDASGLPAGSATTDADGTWTITAAVGTPLRLEISGLGSSLRSGPSGGSSGSSVRFVTSPAGNVNFGVVMPTGDTAGEPFLVTNCFVTGDHASGPNANGHVLVMAPYNATSELEATGLTATPSPTPLADANEIGATYGLAYQASSKSVFASAFAKRKADYGPSGPGAIYRIGSGTDGTLGTADDTKVLFLDLNTYFPGAAGVDHHDADSNNLLVDDGVLVPFVGKDSLGDLDLSADGQTLYVLSAANKTLYEIPIGSPPAAPPLASIRAYPLPAGIFTVDPSIPDSDVRPFGIGIKGPRVFVGGVTTAESTVTDHSDPNSGDDTKLNAVVWEIALQTTGGTHTNKFAQVLTFPLGSPHRTGGSWLPWSNIDNQNEHPEPLLVDFAFDGEDMILGLRDRHGDKTPAAGLLPDEDPWPNSQGDILRAAWNGSAWQLESNGTAGAFTGSGVNNNQGPGGGEFYAGEDSADANVEGAQGSLAFHVGRGELIGTVYDPINPFIETSFYSSGWTQFPLSGLERNSFAVYDIEDLANGVYGKAAGLGDLELVSDPLGVEIGNRVWDDTNGNGVQDAGEPGLAGVTVTLRNSSGAALAAAVTDADGTYYFSSNPGTDTTSAKYNLSALAPQTGTFCLSVSLADSALGGRELTAANVMSGSGSDSRDSDGLGSGDEALACFYTPAAGTSNHDLDFGFSSSPLAGPCTILPNDVMQAGYAIFSCKSNGPGTGALGVRDIRATAGLWTNPANRGNDQSANYPETDHWNVEQFDNHEILGVAVDERDNTIYVSTTALFSGIGTAVSPRIYRISRDGGTVDLFATLPGNHGTGWLDVDEEHNQIYVTDMDSGGIYVVPMAAGPGQTGPFASFAPFAMDDLLESVPPELANYFNWAPNGQRVFSVGYNRVESRLYYSVWNTDSGSRTGIPNTVRSVAILASGGIDAASDRLEITIPSHTAGGGSPYSSPVSDIAFDRSGHRMLLAEQTIITGSFGIFSTAHQSRLLQANGSTSGWVMQAEEKFGIGGGTFADNPYNCRGGAAFAPGGGSAGYTSQNEFWVVATGDGLNFQGTGTPEDPYVYTYGLQISPSGGALNSTTAILVDLDNETSNQDKAIYGDVDVRLCPPDPVGLGNLVFLDSDRDSHFTAGIDSGMAGVQVDLYPQGATPGLDLPIWSTLTAVDGTYAFSPLDPGTYFVQIPNTQFAVSQPLFGHLSSTGNGTDNQTDDSGDENGVDVTWPNIYGVTSPLIQLTANSEPLDAAETGYLGATDSPDASFDATWDFGFVIADFGIGNLVFIDANGDGFFTPGVDEPRAGVTVQLFALGQNPLVDPPVATDQTDTSGHYEFPNLGAGSYFVFIPPFEFGPGGDLSGHASVSGTSSGDDNIGEDGLDNPLAVLTGVRSGTIDLSSGGAPTTGTGETGDGASSDDSKDADYDLTIDFGFVPTPDSCLAVAANSGDNDGYELAATGEIDAGGINRLTRSFGVLGSGVVAGVRFTNLAVPRGAQITGAYVVFTGNQNSDFAGTGTPDPATVLVRGNAADTTLPWTTALYDFSDDQDTAASVNWAIGSPWAPGVSGPETTTPDLSSILQEIVNRPGWASGNAISLTIENVAGLDSRRWETFDDTPSMAPQLVICYLPPVAVGNVVFHDLDKNGRYDSGEGVSGVTLELLRPGYGPDGVAGNGDDDAVWASTISGTDGVYQFSNLPAGTYQIRIPASQFTAGGPLAGLHSLPGQDGDSQTDDHLSENGVDDDLPNINGVSSVLIALASGMEPLDSAEAGFQGTSDSPDDSTDLTVDFGFTSLLGLGNLVWLDLNGSGTFNSGEGVDGVTLELYRPGFGPDGIAGNSDDNNIVATTATDSQGHYLFLGLPSGDYVVKIPASNFALGNSLDAAHSLLGNGTDDGVDDNVDENGVDNLFPEINGISSVLIHVADGTEPTTAETGDAGSTDYADANVDFTVDFGFAPPVGIGNTVWIDANHNGTYDSGEGVNGVTVELYEPGVGPDRVAGTADDADVVSTVVTADLGTGSGLYSFATHPGTFEVRIPASQFQSGGPLEGYRPISPAGGDNQVDDDVDQNGWADGSPATTGVTSGLIVLADNTEPVGETGHASPAGSFDAQVDSTVDFAFDLPAAISGSVFVDTDNNGSGDALINIVTLTLYSDLNGDGDADDLGEGPVDNPNVSGPDSYVITTVDGTYQFTGLTAGGYVVKETQPAGYATVSDLDSTTDSGGSPADPANTSVTDDQVPVIVSAGETDTGNDFIEAQIKPLSFLAWQAENALGGQNGAAQNPDGDLYTNLEEFAFCFPPDSGINAHCPLELSLNDQGTPNDVSDDTITACIRRVEGIIGVTYTLETIADLSLSGPDGAGWTDLVAAPTSITSNGDGTETACYANVQTANGLGIAQGFVRLRVNADLNGDSDTADAGETARTPASGWLRYDYATQCATCSVPFVKCALFSGVIDSNTASALNLTSAVGGGDLAALLTAPCYIVEITDGPHAGQRWNVNAAASSATLLGVTSGTTSLTENMLSGAHCIVRSAFTFAEIFPPEDYNATTNPATSDRILTYNASASPQWQTHSLIDLTSIGGGKHWMLGGSSTDDTCLDPCQGFFFHRKAAAGSTVLMGEVSENAIACPLASGHTLIGSPYPLAQSPEDRAMTWDGVDFNGFTGSLNPATADQLQFWQGDVTVGLESYDTWWLLDAAVDPYRRWAETGDSNATSQDAALLFPAGHAAFYHVPAGNPTYVMPLGWTP